MGQLLFHVADECGNCDGLGESNKNTTCSACRGKGHIGERWITFSQLEDMLHLQGIYRS